MSTALLVSPSTFRNAARRPLAVLSLLTLLALGLCVAFPGHALDLVAFTGITGPLTSALTQIAALGPGIKALVGFVGFVVALISLSALRNFGPVLFYVGLAIFAAVLDGRAREELKAAGKTEAESDVIIGLEKEKLLAEFKAHKGKGAQDKVDFPACFEMARP